MESKSPIIAESAASPELVARTPSSTPLSTTLSEASTPAERIRAATRAFSNFDPESGGNQALSQPKIVITSATPELLRSTIGEPQTAGQRDSVTSPDSTADRASDFEFVATAGGIELAPSNPAPRNPVIHEKGTDNFEIDLNPSPKPEFASYVVVDNKGKSPAARVRVGERGVATAYKPPTAEDFGGGRIEKIGGPGLEIELPTEPPSAPEQLFIKVKNRALEAARRVTEIITETRPSEGKNSSKSGDLSEMLNTEERAALPRPRIKPKKKPATISADLTVSLPPRKPTSLTFR